MNALRLLFARAFGLVVVLVRLPGLLLAAVRWHSREARLKRELGPDYEGPLAE